MEINDNDARIVAEALIEARDVIKFQQMLLEMAEGAVREAYAQGIAEGMALAVMAAEGLI